MDGAHRLIYHAPWCFHDLRTNGTASLLEVVEQEFTDVSLIDNSALPPRRYLYCLSCEEIMPLSLGCRHTEQLRRKILAICDNSGSTDHMAPFSIDEIDRMADLERDISLHQEEHWIETASQKLP
jgi:hypothetical protein